MDHQTHHVLVGSSNSRAVDFMSPGKWIHWCLTRVIHFKLGSNDCAHLPTMVKDAKCFSFRNYMYTLNWQDRDKVVKGLSKWPDKSGWEYFWILNPFYSCMILHNEMSGILEKASMNVIGLKQLSGRHCGSLTLHKGIGFDWPINLVAIQI